MSNSDSFINEVAEEVRKDRMMLYLRRYGWLVGLCIAALVGWVGWSEWRKASERAAAQAFGDAVLAALDGGTTQSRVLALSEIDVAGDREVLRTLLLAAEQAGSDAQAAAEALRALAEDAEADPLYRDLAALKLVLLPQPVLTTADRLDRLAPLTAPGNPFRLVATEVQALVHLERSDRDAARAAFQTLLSDAEASPAQTSRAEQMLQILGGAPEAL